MRASRSGGTSRICASGKRPSESKLISGLKTATAIHMLRSVFGKTPVFCREGGSIPVVSTFQEELGVPTVLFGVGLPDENAHAPNERLDLGNFHSGVVASAILYDEIGKIAKA